VQVEVVPADPAFKTPTKFVGPFFPKDQSDSIGRELGWLMKKDGDRGWRHVVPSPKPKHICDISLVKVLARRGTTLVYGGGPILQAIHLSGRAAGNRVFAKGSKLVEDDVREGRSIADAMRDAGGFPPVLTHMVAIGEETGDLPKMLGRVSDSLDFEVDNGLRRLTALVEPIIVLVMGGFVGFVVLSVLLPIFQAQNAVK